MPSRNKTLLDAQHKLLVDVWPKVCLRLELDPAETPVPKSTEKLDGYLRDALKQEKASRMSRAAGGHYAEARAILETIEALTALESVAGE